MLLVIMAVAMMTTTDRLAQLINKLNKSWRKDAKKAVAYLQRLIASGMKFEEALDNVQRHYGKLFTLPELRPALVEAAAYAYGIVPTMLTKAQVESMGEELADKWDESGMTLSEKLHGVGVKMRGAIVSTLQEQMRRNKTWTEAARALYDGYGDDGQNVYNGGKDIISRQDLPKYLQKVREATGNDLQALAEQRQAIDNINRLAKNGAPNKALQAAYNKLLEAVQKGNEKAIEKAVEVAVNEKSRYVAERITRTEMARAWADGFVAKMKKDADIVAVKFKLSSRHPVFDICDMYAKADMYGLGAGIYPKDKLPPLPVHPHCLCRYVEVIEGEVDMQQQRDQVREAGDKWLNSLPESRRVQVLGRKGLKEWEDGKDWRKYMRGYAGLREVKSRLNESILKRRRIGTQGQQIIDKATYSKLVKEFLNDGGIIIRGEEADRFLEKQGAYASYLVGSKIAFIRDGATVSDVLEEMYHAKQDRRGDYNNLVFSEMILRREIDAQKYLLKMSEKYKIPIEEIQVTTQNLKTYQLKLQEFLKQGGNR
nr:MAG TPA: minor capsid protein [Caudoviricetes sp.]